MNFKLRREGSALVVLLGAISFAVLALQQSTQLAPSVDRLRLHVTYLASDALEGRRTGTPGANGAAQYIAGEFSRLGLRPGIQRARPAKTRGEALWRYLQQFPYVAGAGLGKENELLVAPAPGASAASLRLRDDWMPLGLSSNGRIPNGQAAFVGYGITAAELKYDDYAGSNITGEIAIALSGTPDGDNPHGQFGRYEDVRWKAIAARNAGAKALIVVAFEENFKEDRLSHLRYDNSAGDAGLPVVAISRQAAARLLGQPDLGKLTSFENAVREASLKKIAPPPGWTLEKERLLLPIVGTLTLSVDVVRQEVAAENVIAILEGSDANLKNEAIVIGAHYDHLGLGGEGSLAAREGEVHHGADDNASGTAGVLELARILSAQRSRLRRTIVFIAFSGEEEGLLGSNYYVNHPVVPLANTVAMINMDMIGRLKDRKLIIGGVGTAPEWRAIIESANLLQNLNVNATGSTAHAGPAGSLPIVTGANGRMVVGNDISKQFLLTLNEDGYGPSDHSSFYVKQVPVLFFWTGTHEDYHKPSDTADKLNYEDEARILGIVSSIVRDVDANDKRPTYTVAKSESSGRAIGFRVYLGTIPNYSDSTDGLLLDGVRDDSPAAKAGLKGGDRIVKLAGRDVRNVYDYTYVLGEMKAGQEYEVEIVRGAERLKLKLTPAARK